MGGSNLERLVQELKHEADALYARIEQEATRKAQEVTELSARVQQMEEDARVATQLRQGSLSETFKVLFRRSSIVATIIGLVATALSIVISSYLSKNDSRVICETLMRDKLDAASADRSSKGYDEARRQIARYLGKGQEWTSEVADTSDLWAMYTVSDLSQISRTDLTFAMLDEQIDACVIARSVPHFEEWDRQAMKFFEHWKAKLDEEILLKGAQTVDHELKRYEDVCDSAIDAKVLDSKDDWVDCSAFGGWRFTAGNLGDIRSGVERDLFRLRKMFDAKSTQGDKEKKCQST